MSNQIDYDAVSFVISSRYRVAAILALNEMAQTPSEISKDKLGSKDQIAHISRALQRMVERDLAELLVSEDRKKGRIYGLTEKGEMVAETVEKRQ